MTKKKTKTTKPQILKLRGKAIVFIDWANVYNWRASFKQPVNPEKLFKYLKTYPKIQSINFYYGKDKNLKSKEFLKNIKKIGYKLTTKPVKYITVGKVANTTIKKRKCDFDIEISMSVYDSLKKGLESFIFFSLSSVLMFNPCLLFVKAPIGANALAKGASVALLPTTPAGTELFCVSTTELFQKIALLFITFGLTRKK